MVRRASATWRVAASSLEEGHRHAAGVVVGQDHRAGGGQQRHLHHLADVQVRAGHVPLRQPLAGQEPALAVQAQQEDQFPPLAGKSLQQIRPPPARRS